MLTASAVKAEAARLGFDPVGIASAERFFKAERRLVEWVRRGNQAGMGWIDEARARRSCRPDELLAGACSLIVVGAAYSVGSEGPPAGLHGRVARYARGRDYHDLLTERLGQLVDFLHHRAAGEARTRVFVDTAPLVEREAAARAGLGFIGKNTCLLTRRGSYVLLGAILTDLPLAPDSAPPRDCGSCRLCLEACPTGALTEAYQLDARLCISYLTIEERGSIPPELRPKLGDHLFGCDVCQEVCPWNHGRGPIPWPELASPASRDLDLLELLGLDNEAFRNRFRGSPLKRAKRRGLLRNAAVVLGNQGDPRAVPALSRALAEDSEPLVRGHAAWALRRIGGSAAEAALAEAFGREVDPGVRAELIGKPGP